MDLRQAVNRVARINRADITASPAMRRGAGRLTRFVISVLRAFLLIGLSFVILYPLLYMLSVSLRNPAELYDPTVVWIPKSFTLDNFKNTMAIMKYLPGMTEEGWDMGALLRTGLLSTVCTVLQVFTCALTGYGFARFRFRGRGVLFMLALLTLIVPSQIINMPLYVNYVGFTRWTAGLHQYLPFLPAGGIPMVDTIAPLALSALFGVGIRAGLFVYLFRQFFKNMPGELEEAAYLDGCGPISAYFRIMLVNAGPILLVTFLFGFVWYWNDYQNVTLFYNQAYPLSLVVANLHSTLFFQVAGGSEIERAIIDVYKQVGALLFIAPVLLLYIILQRFFMQSIVTAGIVG